MQPAMFDPYMAEELGELLHARRERVIGRLDQRIHSTINGIVTDLVVTDWANGRNFEDINDFGMELKVDEKELIIWGNLRRNLYLTEDGDGLYRPPGFYPAEGGIHGTYNVWLFNGLEDEYLIQYGSYDHGDGEGMDLERYEQIWASPRDLRMTRLISRLLKKHQLQIDARLSYVELRGY